MAFFFLRFAFFPLSHNRPTLWPFFAVKFKFTPPGPVFLQLLPLLFCRAISFFSIFSEQDGPPAILRPDPFFFGHPKAYRVFLLASLEFLPDTWRFPFSS